MKKISTTLYLDGDVDARITNLSAATAIPKSVLVRACINDMLPRLEAAVARGEPLRFDGSETIVPWKPQ